MKYFFQLLILLSFPLALVADEVNLTVQTDKVVHQIDERVYGHFLENIYHSCNNGIWGDIVWNRSFELLTGGLWSSENDTFTQSALEPQVFQLLDNADLRDYEFSFEAKKTGGKEGFLIPFHYRSEKEFQWINLGGWNNTRHGIERRLLGQERHSMVGPSTEGKIDQGKFHKITLRCEGKKVIVTLDGEKILEYTDEKNLDSGKVGFGTWETQAEFKNFSLRKLDGTVIEPKFSTIVQMPESWETYGQFAPKFVATDALNGEWFIKIKGEGEFGILQKSFCFRKNETYQGTFWTAGPDAERLVVEIPSLHLTATAAPTRRTKTIGGTTWMEISFEFTAPKDDFDATLKIGLKNGGSTQIDQISLMPKSWKEQYDGLRPDLLEAMDALKAPVIRWPGGCYASCYRWKDGIGPQESRKSNDRIMWDDRDPNSFGTDEFMKLCKRLGSEPIMVVNMGSEHWYPADYDRSELIQDIFDWIEYCNGPADSKWGKIRAENGHPEPYNIKYWELDNETWGWTVQKYSKAVNELAPLIRAKYPDLVLLACGSNNYGDTQPDEFPWNKYLIQHSAEHFDYLSIHHYQFNPDLFDNGPREYEAYIAKHRELIAKSKNPKMKIYCSEWNAMSIDWRSGLYCGGILNGFERVGDIFKIGGPALFLRHTTSKAWDNAFINHDNVTWFPGTNYVVMKLYREHFAPNLLALEGDQKGTNCVATKTENGKSVILKFVNPTESEKRFSVSLEDFNASATTLQLVRSDDLHGKNSLAEPKKISPKQGPIKVDGKTVRFVLPAHSVGVARVSQ